VSNAILGVRSDIGTQHLERIQEYQNMIGDLPNLCRGAVELFVDDIQAALDTLSQTGEVNNHNLVQMLYNETCQRNQPRQ
jgi:hypothetical protein